MTMKKNRLLRELTEKEILSIRNEFDDGWLEAGRHADRILGYGDFDEKTLTKRRKQVDYD